MLLPLPMSPLWNLNSSGNYARLHKTDFTFGTPSSWIESDRRDDGNSNYLHSQGVLDAGVTNATLSSDQGMFLSYFSPGTGSGKQIDIQFGWSNDAPNVSNADAIKTMSGVNVRVWSDGKTEVYKDGTLYANGDVSGQQSGKQNDLQTVDICAFPIRERELLILSNQGTGLSAIFDDLDPDNPPVGASDHVPILPSTKFWFQVFGDATIELAKLHFPTVGNLWSKKFAWAENVPSGTTITPTVYPKSIAQTSIPCVAVILTDPDSLHTVFDNGTDCRLNLALGSDGTFTPCVYAVEEEIPWDTTTTAGTSIDVTDYIVDCTVDVGDDPSAVTAKLIFKNGEEVENLGVTNFYNMSNRAVQIFLGNRLIISGRTEAPEYVQGINDTADRISIVVRDHWKALETYYYSDPKALDGFVYTDAIKWVVQSAGFADADIWYVPNDPSKSDYIDLVLPDVGTQNKDFNVDIRIADTPAQALKDLVETYAGDYHFGFQPYNYKDERGSESRFRMFKPNDTDGAIVKLYCDQTDAYAALTNGFTTATIDEHNIVKKRVFNNYRDTLLEPEANFVCVVGYDPVHDRPLRKILFDNVSADPGIAPSGRNNNWLGEIRKYMVVNASLTTQDAVDHCCQTIFDKTSVAHLNAEFECQMLVTDQDHLVWKGDVVELDGYGRYRITSFHAQMIHEAATNTNDYKTFRKVNYTATFIGDSFTE